MTVHKLWNLGFPPAHQLRRTDGEVLVILRNEMADYVFCMPAEPFKKSIFWSPRFSSWKQEEREDIYATVKNEDGTEKKLLRLVLTCDQDLSKGSTSKLSFSLQAGSTAVQECRSLAGQPYDLELLTFMMHDRFVTHNSSIEDDLCDSSTDEFYLTEDAHGFIKHGGADGDWVKGCHWHCNSVIAHKMLLTYLLGLSVNTSEETAPALAVLMANVVALAELYDFEDVVRPSVSRDLRQCSKLWEDIAKEPQFYLPLSIKLQDMTMFEEALRHTLSTTQPGRYLPIFKAVADTTSLSEQDVEQLTTKYRHKLDGIMAEVEKTVVLNTLPSSYVKLLDDPANTILGKDRTQAEYYKSLVRMIFKEWFDKQWMTVSTKGNVYDRFKIVKLMIEAKQYKRGDKRSILGENVHQQIADIFQVSKPTDKDQETKESVRDPVKFISFYMEQFFERLSESLNAVLGKTASSRVDTDRFTHFKFDKNDLPWDVEPEIEIVRHADALTLEAAGITRRRRRERDRRGRAGGRGQGRT